MRYLSLISNLQINNIIQKNPAGTAVVLTSDGLKKYIYSELAEKEKFHRSLANKLSGNLPSFNKIELARQFELGKNYDMCFNTFMSELNEVEKLSLFSYMKKILTSMLKIPFTHLQTNQVQFKLSEVNFKLSDFKASLNNIESVVAEELEEEKQIGLAVIKGSSLIGLGEYEKGKEYINSIISNLTDGKNKHILLTELAYAEFDQNKFY